MPEQELLTMSKEDLNAILEEAIKAANTNEDLEDKHGKGPRIQVGDSPEDKVLADKTGGWEFFCEFARDIYKAGPWGDGQSENLKRWAQACKTAGHVEEGEMGQGGYLVPEEFRAQLLMTSLEASIVRPKCTRIPMATNSIGIPAVVDASHATTFFGGVQIYRPGEAQQKTASKPAFGKVKLTLHKLTGFVYVSDEIMEDSPISLQPLLTTMFGEAIAFTEDDDFLNGTGTNMALGAFNAGNPSLVAVSKESGQDADTIVTENILKMWSRVHPRSRKNAIFLANNDTLTQLCTLVIAVGTGGVPVYMPAGGVSGMPYDTLLGKPLIYTEKMQTLGDQADIGVADFSQYLIGDKGGVKTAQSIHLRFDYDEVAFRFVMRYDGQPWWLSPLTPKRSTDTLSPFVVIEARA
ncbi:MAG: phage major capsid protein [Chloroflexota bacterium]|nr:phage major capsid protein [Chloroflexota bacterium]